MDVLSLSKLSLFDEDDETMMNKDRHRSDYVEYDEMIPAGRSDRDDRQQQRLFWSSLICFCLSAPFFRIITDRDYQTTSFQKRGGKDDVNGKKKYWNIILDR